MNSATTLWLLWKIAPTSLMKRDLPPPHSGTKEEDHPPHSLIHRVINLLNSAISPWNPSCTLAAAATFWKYPVTRVVPLWGKHRCNITVPWTPFFSPFFFHDARNHARPTRDSLPPSLPPWPRGWVIHFNGKSPLELAYRLYGGRGCRLKQMQMNRVSLHYYFLNDYWSVVPVVNETCEQI